MTTKGYLEELEWRGLVHQTTAEDELSAFLASALLKVLAWAGAAQSNEQPLPGERACVNNA